ncbi:unnamed protein product [Rhizophagus irregularis]|nr:unnamed protein product [Rhizophagus irregularis]
MRPGVIPRTPLEYKELMEQCWNADPTKRPDINNNSSKFGNLLEIRTVTEAHRSQDNFSIPNKIEDIGNNSLSSKNN